MKNLPINSKSSPKCVSNIKYLNRNECRLILKSDLSVISELELFLDTLRRYLRIKENKFANILISLTEVIKNSIIHGNKFSPAKFVYIFVYYKPDSVSFSIEDEGEGFDYFNVKDPTNEKRQNVKSGGRGVYLIKNFADAFHYSKGGRHLKMFFHVK